MIKMAAVTGPGCVQRTRWLASADGTCDLAADILTGNPLTIGGTTFPDKPGTG
jgi:hypothetical protein